MIDGFQRGSERGARDVGTLANAGYRNGRGSAMRYGSRIGRDTGRFGILRLRRISLPLLLRVRNSISNSNWLLPRW